MQLRPFQNSDSPAVCEIWHRHVNLRGKFQGLTPAILERVVLSKTYFDPQGLWLAWDDNQQPLGFVHAGFGITEQQVGLERTKGVIAQLMCVDSSAIVDVAAGLLEVAEDYLRTRGAGEIAFGGYFPLAPFYLGLYGGSRAVGVLQDDQGVAAALRAFGYQNTGQVIINHWRLSDFRQLIDRQQLLIGRSFVLENVSESQPQTWLQASHYDVSLQRSFRLKEKRSQQTVGRLAFWEMEPLVENWGQNGVGLVELSVDPTFQRQGLATYMVGESLRQLKQSGVAMVEIQHLDTDLRVASLCKKLGFSPVDATQLWHKTLAVS
jgi:ribosomal protein S18 acetylase RimI-like enzyme